VLLDGTCDAGGINGATSSAINSTGAGLLIVSVTNGSSADPLPTPTDTYNNTWLGPVVSRGETTVAVWWAVNPVVGTGHSVSYSDTGSYSSIGFAAFSGSPIASPLDKEATNVGGVGFLHPGEITPSQNGELLISAMSHGFGTSASIDSGFTIIGQQPLVGGQNYGGVLAYLAQDTASYLLPKFSWAEGVNGFGAAAVLSFRASLEAPVPALDVGINFRATSGYVTDGAGETYCLAADTYPTTRSGVTFGWSTAAAAIDRNAGVDRRFAGIGYLSASADYFQVDLPATGDYDIYFAAGDYSSSNAAKWSLRDNATSFASTTGFTSAADRFKDATDTEYSSAAWPGSNTKATRTFASTTFKAVTTSNDANVLAHLRIVQLAAPATGGGTAATLLAIGVI